MEQWLKDIFPVLDVDRDFILSKQGDYTVGYRVTKPEIFTLSGQEHESIHQAFIRALKVLPKQTIFHMMDWYVTGAWKAGTGEDESFLSRASSRFFHERPYLEHTSYIFLTKHPAKRKAATSALSSLLRRSIVPEESLDEQAVQDFLDSCGQFERILEDSGFLRLTRLRQDDIWSNKQRPGILEKYCFLNSEENRMVRDISFTDGLQIGDERCQLFTLGDAGDLPSLCGPRIDYDKYSTDRTKFSVGYASVLGQLLPCNHIYNQYIFIGDGAAVVRKLEARRLRLQSLSAYSRENAMACEAVNAFLNEAAGDQRVPVKAHFNVLAWTDQAEEVTEVRNKVSSALAQLDATPKQETVGAPQIWWAGIPGNESEFPMNDCVDTFLEQASCFLTWEGSSVNSVSPFGIRLVDRLSGRPLHVDISDEPMRRGLITNRNKVVLGGTGSGKSMFMNHMMRSYYEQGAHIVIIDVGGSYKGLCDLLGGYYFAYEENKPICFNPFYLGQGDIMDTEKRESIKALLLALWKKDDEPFRRSEYVALSNAISGYLDHLSRHGDIFPGFNSFYEFLQTGFLERLKTENVKEKDFDVDNFLYVLRPYYKGGEFDYLLNARENLDILQQRFIVFELDKLLEHPILLAVSTLVVGELFIGKMRKLPGVRKVLDIEETWKAIMKAAMAEFIRYLYKTVRKFFGEIITVTQEVDDIVNSPIVKETIINMSDCKIILDLSKFQHKFDQLQAMLGTIDKGKIMSLSLNKANDPERRYRELMIDLAGRLVKVYGFEPSPEEYFAYTTEQREKVRVMEYAAKYGSMQKGIEMLVRDERESTKKR